MYTLKEERSVNTLTDPVCIAPLSRLTAPFSAAQTNSIVMELELPYPTHSGNNGTKHGGGRHYLTPEHKAYRLAVLLATGIRIDKAPLLTGPISCDWLIAPPDDRERDAVNVLKVVEDALTLANVWPDDSNKVIRSGSWTWTDPIPGGAIFLTLRRVS